MSEIASKTTYLLVRHHEYYLPSRSAKFLWDISDIGDITFCKISIFWINLVNLPRQRMYT